MYIVRDAKREADRLGIPFGELCDPLGEGIDELPRDRALGRPGRGADARVRASPRCAGSGHEATRLSRRTSTCGRSSSAPACPGTEAHAAIGDPAALKAAPGERRRSHGIGLWGVPSFRVGDFVAWGQDRLPLLADRLRRHAIA